MTIIPRIFLTLCVAFIANPFQLFAQVDAIVNEIIFKVNRDSLLLYVGELSGAQPVNIGGFEVTILSREAFNPGNELAAQYISKRLTGFGMPVFHQQFYGSGHNLYAVQTGKHFPNQKYIICAHYDCKPGGGIAPGADDNASGTAAVLEAARILSNYEPSYTIVYALWDEEELGLVGSRFYAETAALAGDTILGVINLDMIAWDSDRDFKVTVNTSDIARSAELAEKMAEVNKIYNIGLVTEILNPGRGSSDHVPFWQHDYSAIFLHEYYLVDFNWYYHSPDDLMIHFHEPYYERAAKLAIGTLSSLAAVHSSFTQSHSIDAEINYSLHQNYPNPFNPATTIRFSLPRPEYVTLTVYNLLGTEVRTLVSNRIRAGIHSVVWDAANEPSGIYFYRLKAGSYSETKQMLLVK